MEVLKESFQHSLLIAALAFIMMIWVDYLNVVSRGNLASLLKNRPSVQYVTSSFLGVIPGCFGCFMNVSFYTHGLFTFGAVVAGMIATSGDEAFVMLALFPREALLLFLILFVLGLVTGPLVDKVLVLFKIEEKFKCDLLTLHEKEDEGVLGWQRIINQLKSPTLARLALLLFSVAALLAFGFDLMGHSQGSAVEHSHWEHLMALIVLVSSLIIAIVVPNHYLKEHIWQHLAKKHFFKILLWSFLALVIVNMGLAYWDLEQFVQSNLKGILIIACFVGLLPVSGPHLIFVMLFAKGLVPFSVLLASSIVQDGYGLLPLLSYSTRTAVVVKLINLLLGLGVGGLCYIAGW
jgi:hypothetical protein